MIDQDYVIVYWAPCAYEPGTSSWSQLYSEPVSVLSQFNKKRNKKTEHTMFNCPAYVDIMKNTFVVNNVLNAEINLPDEVHNRKFNGEILRYDNLGGLQLRVERESSFTDYTDIVYNMSWSLFADEPLKAKFVGPYFPAYSPGDGVILSVGKFDIGQWYRKFDLSYHVPSSTKKLLFKENDPLFYIEFETTKKIIFKRYIMTPELLHLSAESAQSINFLGRVKSLAERYAIAKKAKIPEQVLKLIKNNVVE
jgi:hypothetical protein